MFRLLSVRLSGPRPATRIVAVVVDSAGGTSKLPGSVTLAALLVALAMFEAQ